MNKIRKVSSVCMIKIRFLGNVGRVTGDKKKIIIF